MKPHKIKKWIVLTLMLCMILPINVYGAGENLIQNPAFENLKDNVIPNWITWKPETTNTYKASVSDGVYTGSVTAGRVTLYQTVVLSKEQKERRYRLTGQIKTKDLKNASAVIRLKLVNSENKDVQSIEGTQKINQTTSWKDESIEIAVPETMDGKEIKGIKVELVVSSSTTGAGETSFQNLKLEDIGSTKPLPEGDPIDTLIKNGGYEKQVGQLPASWNVWESSGGLAVSNDRDVYHQGYASVKLSNKEQDKNSRGTLHQTIEPISDELQGQSVKISQYIKTENFSGAGLSIRLQYVSKSGKKVEMTTQSIKVENTQDWTLYDYIIPMPKEPLKSMKVEYMYDSSKGSVWIDETRVETYIKATAISVTPTHLIFKELNKTEKLNVSLQPKMATDQKMTYKSQDASIASVDDQGNVTSHKEGSTKIILTQADGLKKEVSVLVNTTPLDVSEKVVIQTKQNETKTGTLPEGYQYELSSQCQFGSFVILKDNSYIYQPNPDFVGEDEAMLLVKKEVDGKMLEGLMNVSITVLPINAAPHFEAVNIQVNENEKVTGQFVASDAENEKITFEIKNKAQHGVLELKDNTYTYTPNKDYTGYDSADIIARDASGNIQEAKMTIYVVKSIDHLLNDVKTGHSILLANNEKFEDIKKQIQTDQNMKKWSKDIYARCDELLKEKPVPYSLPDGVRLDTQGSKNVVDLAFGYRISGKQEYFNRAMEELKNLCGQAYPTWHPEHLLDTAMTANGVALAYDWLYPSMKQDDRKFVEQAIYEKSLVAAKKEYESNHRFVTDGFNWNFVCNGGFATSAFVLAHSDQQEYRQLAGEILQRAYKSIQYGLPQYASEGESIEGISYWDYGTRYLVSFLATVSSATGKNDFLKAPGIKETALYPIYMTGKAGSYNYSDNDMMDAVGYLNAWFATSFNEPSYAWYHKYYMDKGNKATIYDLIYYSAENYNAKTPTKRDIAYEKQAVVTMRHDFTGPDTSYLGFKGGMNGAPHGDLDAGSFVYDLYGKRWALDFGKEDYNLPGYWELGPTGQRWNYYRKNALGHNTLVIQPTEGANQTVPATSSIYETKLNETNGAYGILDLAPSYQQHAVSLKRGFAYFNRESVLIRDEYTLKNSYDLYWQMHTDANVSISQDGRIATLTKDGKSIQLKILENNHQKFETMAAKPYSSNSRQKRATTQNPNEGVTKLYIKDHGQIGTFNVYMGPVDQKDVTVLPLKDWKNYKFNETKQPVVKAEQPQKLTINKAKTGVKTGDQIQYMGYIGLGCFSLGVIGVCVYMNIKKKHKD